MTRLHRKVFIILLPLAITILLLGYGYFQVRKALNLDHALQTTQFAALQGSKALSQYFELGLEEFDLFSDQITECQNDNVSLAELLNGQLYQFKRFSMLLTTDTAGHIIASQYTMGNALYDQETPNVRQPLYPERLRLQLIEAHNQRQTHLNYRRNMIVQLRETIRNLNAQGEHNSPLGRSLSIQLRHLSNMNTLPKLLIAYLPSKQVQTLGLPFRGGSFYLSRPLSDCNGQLLGFYSVVLNNRDLQAELNDIGKVLTDHQVNDADISIIHHASASPLYPLQHLSNAQVKQQTLTPSPLAKIHPTLKGIMVNSPIDVTLKPNHTLYLSAPSAQEARQFGLNLLIFLPLSQTTEQNLDLLQEVGIYVSLALLLFILLSGYLAYTITVPITQLTTQAQVLAAGGQITIKALKRNDEIGELSLAFERMATTIQQKQAELMELAHHDPLTGILNRRALIEDAIGDHAANACVCMMDLDHFKQINDQYGHAVGDAVLQAFCELVKKEIRTHDIFGRIGGEEFTLVLPQTGLDQASKIAERIRHKTEQQLLAVLPSAQSHIVTVSIGVTEWQSGDFHKVLSQADHCLYQAKRAGRNQVVSTLETNL